jgi:hypothetical protein
VLKNALVKVLGRISEQRRKRPGRFPRNLSSILLLVSRIYIYGATALNTATLDSGQIGCERNCASFWLQRAWGRFKRLD